MKTKEELQIELDQLIKKHGEGKVYTIITPLSQDDNCETATIYLKKATRVEIDMVNDVRYKNPSNGLLPLTVVLQACYIGGDELNTVLNNEDALYGCDVPLYLFLHRKSGELKKN